MLEKVGIILLDKDEVIIRIYDQNNQKWELAKYQSYDLATFDTCKHAASTEILEIIANISLTKYAAHVTEWKVCARNVAEIVIHEIANTISMNVELLTLAREQELLCKGLLEETK